MSTKSRGGVPRRLAVGKIVVGLALTVLVAGSATVASARPRLAGTAFEEQRIEFEPGTDNATRAGNVDPGNSDRWILRANAGQVMDLTIDSADDNTVFSVFAPDHNLVGTRFRRHDVVGPAATAGDYAIEVASVDGAAYYQLKVWIDATVRDPLGAVQRMSFAPGPTRAPTPAPSCGRRRTRGCSKQLPEQTMDVTVPIASTATPRSTSCSAAP